jgi:hypothetical protein
MKQNFRSLQNLSSFAPSANQFIQHGNHLILISERQTPNCGLLLVYLETEHAPRCHILTLFTPIPLASPAPHVLSQAA